MLERKAIRRTAGPEVFEIRHETVAHPTRLYQTSMNQAAFLMREVDKVRAELSSTALVYNMRRAINVIGVQAPIPAVPACVTSLYWPVRRAFLRRTPPPRQHRLNPGQTGARHLARLKEAAHNHCAARFRTV